MCSTSDTLCLCRGQVLVLPARPYTLHVATTAPLKLPSISSLNHALYLLK